MTPQTYETLAQAAERTGVSVLTLRRMIAEHKLCGYTIGRRILRVKPEDVDALLRPTSRFWDTGGAQP